MTEKSTHIQVGPVQSGAGAVRNILLFSLRICQIIKRKRCKNTYHITYFAFYSDFYNDVIEQKTKYVAKDNIWLFR